MQVSTKARVDKNAREEFLSLSSSGKNAANRGIKGVLGAVMETLFWGGLDFDSAALSCGMYVPNKDYTCMWALSRYLDKAPEETVKEEWDGMEKSILANFADDVSIGVRSGRLEITVTKQLSAAKA